MSGAGPGVTPGAESEAGQVDSAASPKPEQARPSSADNGADAPGQAKAESKAESTAESSGQADDGDAAAPDGKTAPPDGKTASGGPKPTARRGRRKRSFWAELPILVIIALVLAVVIKTYLMQAFFIPSESMENTLRDRRPGAGQQARLRGPRHIHRGDIVVFNGDGSGPGTGRRRHQPRRAKFAHGFASMFGFGHPGDILIKRVIGLARRLLVACCDAQGRVMVNGVPLTEESYLYPGDTPSENRFNIVVPPGRLWVMGTTGSFSDDSRDHLGDARRRHGPGKTP